MNFDRVSFHKKLDQIDCMIDGLSFLFGAYESPERAEEVFTDLHDAYAPVGLITSNLSEEQAKQFVNSENVIIKAIKLDGVDCAVTTYDNYVYRMPEK